MALVTASLLPDVAGNNYAAAIAATGGSGHYRFSLAAGALPSGLTLGDTGTIAGQTTRAGTFSFTVKATDTVASYLYATRTYSLVVSPASPASLTVSAPTAVTAGAGFVTTITAWDAYGNRATSATGLATLRASDGQTVSSATVMMYNGVNSSVHSLSVARPLTLSATFGALTATTGSVTVNPAAPSTLVVTAPAAATAGTGFGVGLTAYDRYGNRATNYTGTATFTSSDQQAVAGAVTLIGGAGTGTVTLTRANTVTLTAAAGAARGTSGAITVSPLATASSFAVVGPTAATAGTAAPVTVLAKDRYGNTITSYTGTVTFTSSDRQAVAGAVTLVNGVGTGAVTLTRANTVTLTATDGAMTGTSASFKVNATTAASLTVSAPTAVTAGAGFTVTVTAWDAYGNRATKTSGTVTLTASDGQAVSNAAVTLSNGTNSATHTLNVAHTLTLSATFGALTATTGSVTVNPAAPSTLTVGIPTTTTVGAGFALTVTAKDRFGNLATNYNGTATLTASDLQVPSPNYVALTNGTGSTVVTLTKAGTLTLTAVAGAARGTSGAITVSPLATASSFAVVGPTAATAGTAAPVTVLAKDRYGNTITSYTGTVTFTSSDRQAVAGAVTLVNGVGTGAVTLTRANTVTLTATDGAMTGTSASFKVNPGVANSFTVTAPTAVTAGAGFTVTVTAWDAYGNRATKTSGTVTLTASDGQAVSNATVTLSNGTNSATHTLNVAHTLTLSAAAGSATGTSGTITVSPAAVSTFTLGAPTAVTAATGFTLTVTAKDRFGNVVTGYNGTATLTASDLQAPSPNSVAILSGAGSATVTLYKAGTLTLTATAGTVSGTSGSITVQSSGGGSNDWISQYISDPALAALAQADYAYDQSIGYDDMLGLFAQAASEGSILSTSTWTSLQALATPSAAAALSIPGYVQSLTSKVINGDPANSIISTGNLKAGSTSVQLQTLVSDWFLGAAHPSAVTSYGTATYQLASGTLFGSGGPSYKDVYQGQMGDCWLLAGFGVTASSDPSAIRDMFIDNGVRTVNGVQVHVWTVRFFHNGVAEYLTVDSALPAVNGRFFFANMGQSITSTSNVLWVALLEKAYAQLSASGWNQRPQANAYQSLNGGWASTVLPVITGGTQTNDSYTSAGINAALAAGHLITLASYQNVPSLGIVGSHDYSLLGYDSATQTYTLLNPWGWNTNYSNAGAPAPGILHLTWLQISQYFYKDGDCIAV